MPWTSAKRTSTGLFTFISQMFSNVDPKGTLAAVTYSWCESRSCLGTGKLQEINAPREEKVSQCISDEVFQRGFPSNENSSLTSLAERFPFEKAKPPGFTELNHKRVKHGIAKRNGGQQKPWNRGWHTTYFSKLDVSPHSPWKNTVFLSVSMQNKQRSSLTQLSRLKLSKLQQDANIPLSAQVFGNFAFQTNDSGKYLSTVLFSSPRIVLHSHTSSWLWQERTPQVSAELQGSPSNMKFKVFAHKVNFTGAKGGKN